MIVPGGGISLDGERWIACRPDFFCTWACSSKLFRRLVLERLAGAHAPASCTFFGQHASLDKHTSLRRLLGAAARQRLVRLCQAPVRGDRRQCSPICARYTHRVAISNRRLIAADDKDVTFKWQGLSARRTRSDTTR